ncbi:g2024 [Coccomyxa elongata]
MATEVASKRKAEACPGSGRGRSSGPVVLDEDDWTDRIEAIIERDYFPDIPKLQNKLEWLQAIRSRDPELLRQAQLNIAQRRAGMRTPIGASPATFATPGLTSLRAPASLLRTPAAAQTPRADGQTLGSREDESAPSATSVVAQAVAGVSLDRFMARHTSEDNASFNEIVEASNKRRQLAKPWLFENKNQVPLLTDAERLNDGFGTTGQPHDRLLLWPYENKNTMYYDSSQQKAVALTDAERARQVQGPPKQINRRGTRIICTTERSDTPSSTDSPSPAAAQSAANEYSVLATPTFTPGVEDSPFMTWGELEGTPLRLDAEDDIIVQPATGGPQFRVPEASSRDALARHLGQTAAAKLRTRAASARRAAPPLTPGAMPPPTSGLRRKPDGTPSRTPLSSAGRKLAQSLHGRVTAADAQLRASYSALPAQHAGGATSGQRELRRSVTPARTPVRHPAAAEPSSAGPGSAGSKSSLTDDLLNI